MENHPEIQDVYYSLGLLLAEMQKYDEAIIYLKQAGRLMQDRARVFYNLGLIYQYQNEKDKAEKALIQTLTIEPDNFDFLFALADFYIKTNQFEKAKPIAQKLADLYPESTVGNDILRMIQQ